MDVAEFVDMVMPSVGERCPIDGCSEWQDHVCRPDGGAYCTEHCRCEYAVELWCNQRGDLVPRFEWEAVDHQEGRVAAREALAVYRANDPVHRYRIRMSAGD